MSDYLTPWHRECIARGATLLVIPVDPQPTVEVIDRTTGGLVLNERCEWRGTPRYHGLSQSAMCNAMIYGCPVQPGDVLEVAEYSLRCTDVAVKRLEQMTCDEAERAVRPTPIIAEHWRAARLGKRNQDNHILNGIRQSHPEFPADGMVWLVHFEREG